MNKTRKGLVLFLLVCFLLIGSISIFTSLTNGKGDEGNEYNKISQKDKENQKDESQKSQNQGNQKQECTDENGVFNCTCSYLGDEGSQESTSSNFLINEVIIYGLDDEILAHTSIKIKEGSSAYDALLCVLTKEKITHKTTGVGKFIYVSEINGLKEKAYGNNAGWKYYINDAYVSYGAPRYTLKDKDVMEWRYEYD